MRTPDVDQDTLKKLSGPLCLALYSPQRRRSTGSSSDDQNYATCESSRKERETYQAHQREDVQLIHEGRG